MDFTGRVVIVTGASSGIGASASCIFAANGAFLSLVGRNEVRLCEVAKVCASSRGHEPLCLQYDLRAPNSCEEVVRKTVEKYGQVDVLVNCAGNLAPSSLFDSNMHNFDDLFLLNLRVPYQLTQLCLPYLVKTKGNIVNVMATPIRSSPGFVPCSMISDALARFTASSAVELAPEGVKMNSVQPGYTRTNYLANIDVDIDLTLNLLAECATSNKIIEPEEIAKMIVLAASSMFPNLNSANLVVDSAASAF